jgi:hypothetical protein
MSSTKDFFCNNNGKPIFFLIKFDVIPPQEQDPNKST